MSKETNLELKVGIFVMTALVALGIFIFSISDFSFLFRKGTNIKVIFGFANGVKRSAPVRFAGVDAGVVKNIQVIYDEQSAKAKVEVDIWLQQGQVPVDSLVMVNQLGLMGEKYIEIIPGQDKQNTIPDGGTIIGKDPVPMEELSSQMSEMTDQLKTTIEGVNQFLLTEKNQQSLEKTLEAVSAVADDIRNGRGTLGQFLHDDGLYGNLEELTADLKVNPWKLLYRPKKARSSNVTDKKVMSEVSR